MHGPDLVLQQFIQLVSAEPAKLSIECGATVRCCESLAQNLSQYLVGDLLVLRGERAQGQEAHAGYAALVVDLVVRKGLGVFLPKMDGGGGG